MVLGGLASQVLESSLAFDPWGAPVLAWLGFALLLVRVLAIGREGPGRERARWVIWVSFLVSFLAFDLLFAFFLTFAFASGLARLGVFALVGAVAVGNQVGNPVVFW